MKHYRIGQVSKMLNIPVETLRFLEQKGLVKPKKNEDNGYRYYDIWSINQILDYQKYRKIGLSSKETVQIVNAGDFSTLIERLKSKQDEAEYLAHYYQVKAQKLSNYQTVLEHAQQYTGKYIIMNRPENYALFNRTFDKTGLHVLESADMAGAYESLTEYYPFVEHIYCIRKEYFDHPDIPEKAENGLTIKKQWAEEFHIPLHEKMELQHSTTAIFTIVRLGVKQIFTKSVAAGALQFMTENGYELNGDVTGIYLATVHENDEMVRYMELWVPIKATEHKIEEPSFSEADKDALQLKAIFG